MARITDCGSVEVSSILTLDPQKKFFENLEVKNILYIFALIKQYTRKQTASNNNKHSINFVNLRS